MVGDGKMEMVVAKARDWDVYCRYIDGGITFYPYQIAFGITFRYYPHIFHPSIRLHIGPIKLWLCFHLRMI